MTTTWYLHPALPTVLIGHDADGWWLYHTPHARQPFAGDRSRLEVVDRKLLLAWRTVIAEAAR